MPDKAILFGINNYKSISHLRGCENDLEDVRGLLVDSFGFEKRNVKSYSNEKVVQSAIAKGFDWLAEGTGPGDRLVFHFSGHGSYTTSTSSDKDVDELLCLYDMDWSDEQSFIRDTDLGKLTGKVSTGARLTVILDSCHSGTGTRGFASNMRALERTTPKTGLVIVQDTANRLARQRGAANDHAQGIERAAAGTMRLLRQEETPPVYARFVEPPAKIQQTVQRAAARRVRALGESMRATLNHQLLAAAGEKQTAADAYIEGSFRGAFSFFLCDTARTQSTDSFAAIMQRATQRIKADGFGQDPQIEGPFSHERMFGPTGASGTVVPDARPNEPSVPGNTKIELADDSVDSLVDSPTNANESLESDSANLDPLRTLNRLLRVSEKLVDLARTATKQTTLQLDSIGKRAARGSDNEVLVYVHGISEHLPGYSQAWHSSIARHLTHPIRRAEVRWSQLVNARAATERSSGTAGARAAGAMLKTQIDAEIQQRVDRMETIANQRSMDRGGLPSGGRIEAPIRIEQSRSLAIDDFTSYMLFESTRELILNEFFRIVVPELEAGNLVHIVSHSWGTVVSYEGLRRLDGRTLAGHVANLFVAGSALSIGAVQSNLFGRVQNGRAPVHVRRIINLDAGGDVVGGAIGDKFTVDREFLGLDPTGCNTIPFTGLAWNPACAHSSYFRSDNLAVNRDIFAAYINRT